MFEPMQTENNQRPKVRTLLVEDCLVMADKLRELMATLPEIETIGFAVNGEEAVRLAQALRPELVLMDIQMPVMNGIEAARELRICLPETRVILTSATGPAEGMLQLPGLGPVEFLPKARLWDALPRVIEKLFGK